VTPQDFTVVNFAARLKAVGDLWAALQKSKGVDLGGLTTKVTKPRTTKATKRPSRPPQQAAPAGKAPVTRRRKAPRDV
jgi:hypothetical protein